jgi:uncharacterized Zn-binding protein involved in type VI secretion
MPQPAARVGDSTAFGGALLPPGAPTVLIGGMPAANMTTMHVDVIPGTPAPHPPMPGALPGSPTVLIGGSPAIRMGDVFPCGAAIVVGCMTVMIGP